MSYKNQIRDAVLQRGIPHLFHFTQVPNLASIAANGLLSRADIVRSGLRARPSNDYRLDNEDEAISVSVSAINWQMFTSKRAASPRVDWVVLALDPSLLWTHDCRFCRRNAALNEMMKHRGFLGGPWGFRQMFADQDPPPQFQGHAYRKETAIPWEFPTHPDAEVQVFQPISSGLIIGAWVANSRAAARVRAALPGLPDRAIEVDDWVPQFSNGFAVWG